MNNEDKYKYTFRYCECPNGHREHPFVMPHVTLGVDFCLHCGGMIRHEDKGKHKKSHKHTSRREYFYRKAKECSIKKDHSTAIEFYNEVLRLSVANSEKCEALTEIALEYEAIGDYDSAETYWNRTCEAAGHSNVHMYLTEKGDLLFRIGRYEDAISTYEEALKALDALKDTAIGSSHLIYYARIVHYIIYSYEYLEKDNHKEKYHNELKHGIERYIHSRDYVDDEFKANYLSETAWRASEHEGVNAEALILIDYAFKLNPHRPANDYNRKAIILKRGFQYDEALKYYDRALSKDPTNKTFLENKADCMKDKLKRKLFFKRTEPRDLEVINKALKILPEGCDNGPYLSTKAEILDQLGEGVKARICQALAAKRYDEVDKAEKQLKKLKSSETYINITGTRYYRNFAPFREGTIVDLIRESDNPHDRYAIRVEINGETVGYVANNQYTLIKEVKSARDLKYSKSTRAEVQFILFNKWVIAKLI